MRKALLGVALAATLAAAPAALAKPLVVHSSLSRFVPSNLTITQGDTVTHSTADTTPHNLASVALDENGERLFSSGAPELAAVRDVAGVADLDPGAYRFLCTIHPNMTGTLTVEAGTPVPVEPPPPPAAPIPLANVPTVSSVTTFGGHLYATSYGAGNVLRFPLLAGGALGPGEIYADGFSSPLGVSFAPDGTMFVSDSHPSMRPGRATAGRVWAVDGTSRAKSVVVDELPNGRHNTNGTAAHSGRLYIANGNSTDDGVAGGDPEVYPWSGALLSVPLGARNLVPEDADVTVEATGMRNLYDVAFRPGTDEAWIPTNGPDELDPYGEDTLNKVDVTGPAPDFGFPGCVYAAPPADPEFAQNPAVADTRPCDPAHAPPEALLGLHTSADGLAFGPDDGFWGGDLFIARFGNFFGDRVVGHDVIRVPIDANGRAGEPQLFLPEALPLDVTFGPPGTGMYIADFGTGRITLVKAP